MALKAGDEVDRYRIVAPLGAGGMGEVYQAFDTRLQRNVALKLLHMPKDEGGGGSLSGSGSGGALSGSRGSARMLREARAAAQLDHPNVVHVYDVGELQAPEELRGTAFLAMELIKGRPLRAFFKDPSISMAERLRWLADVARALSAAHAQGLVHRDIKPENVMLRHDGVIKVLDFGIAKRQSYGEVDPSQPTEEPQIVPTLTTKGVAVGTPYYMSPEQMRGDALDGRADQFSWGVMAFELLAGIGPWRTDTDSLGLVAQVLSKPAEPPAQLNADIPPHISAAIVRALAKTREERFPTMEALLQALDLASAPRLPSGREAAESGAGGSGRRTPPAQPSGDAKIGASAEDAAAKSTLGSRIHAKPTRPRALVASLAVLGVALVAAAVVEGVTLSRRARAGAPRTQEDAHLAGAHARECSTSAQCVAAHEGKAFRCRPEDGVCVALASADCTVHAEPGDLQRDDTVWLGSLFAKDDDDQRAIELGRRDLAAMPASLPAAGGTSVRRPIGIIACEDSDEAARHLALDVRVPAVIGFSGSQRAIDLLSSALVPRGILSVVATNNSSLITSIRTPEGKPRMILRTSDNTLQMARAISAFSSQVLEPRLRSDRRRPIRIALVRGPSAGGLGFSDGVVSTLRVNGASVAENQSSFSEHVVDVDTPKSVEEARTRLLATRPDIIVYSGSDLQPAIFSPLEASWPASEPRPVYVSGLSLDDLAAFAKLPGMNKRLYGVTTPSNTTTNAKFTLHYNATFSGKITPTVSPASTYDAFYVLAYAAYAVGDGPVTGESLAGAVKRLVGGPTRIEVGPAKILEALGTLGSGGNIDLQGAGSDLDFDATGESPTDHVILCVGKDATGAPTGVESGLTWDAKTGKLRGAMKCP